MDVSDGMTGASGEVGCACTVQVAPLLEWFVPETKPPREAILDE